MMRYLASSLALFALLVPATVAAAPVATLEVMLGRVFVDQGKGLALATARQTVAAGNRIMVMGGSSAILFSSESGCVLSLRDPGQFVVPALENCFAGQASVMRPDTQINPANGVYETVVLDPPPPFAPAAGIAPVMAGGLFAAGVVGTFVVTQFLDKEESPVSIP